MPGSVANVMHGRIRTIQEELLWPLPAQPASPAQAVSPAEPPVAPTAERGTSPALGFSTLERETVIDEFR